MKINLGLSFFAAAATLLLFQNCAPDSSSSNNGPQLHTESYNFNGMSNVALVPTTDQLDTKCMTSSVYDACVFQKNVVAQTQKPLTGSLSAQDYSSSQIYGVKLTGLAGNGLLDNGTFHVTSLPSGATSANGNYKVRAQNDTSRSFAQIQTYYWMNRATEYIGGRTGVFPAKGHAINVIVDDLIAGWSSGTNSIHLRLSSTTNVPLSWSPEIAIHFLGLANLHFASGGAIAKLDTTRNVDCNLRGSSCCSSSIGCARAISSGVGDYFAAMMFPTQPTLGETWTNSTSGMSICGVGRNLDANAGVTAAAAYSACPSANGDTTVMGAVYASIWWSVRGAAAKASATGAMEIDTLFMNHMYDINGSDTFTTDKAKIIALDQYAFKGSHGALFQAEFAARGL